MVVQVSVLPNCILCRQMHNPRQGDGVSFARVCIQELVAPSIAAFPYQHMHLQPLHGQPLHEHLWHAHQELWVIFYSHYYGPAARDRAACFH